MCKIALLPFSCGHRIALKFEICDLGPCPKLEPRSSNNLSTQKVPCVDCQRTREPGVRGRPSFSKVSSNSSEEKVPSLRRLKSFSFLDSKPKSPFLNFACSHERQISYKDLPKALPQQKFPCIDCQVAALRQKINQEVRDEAERLWPKVKKARKSKGLPKKEWMTAEAHETFIAEELGDGKQLTFFVMRKWDQDLKGFGVLTGLAPTSTPSCLPPTPDSASG